jgi:hypothetical protein
VRLPDPRRSRIVLIGISDYADPALLDLPQVSAGVKELAAMLSEPADGAVALGNCEVIDEGGLERIGRKLRAAARQAEDLLLVYYSGHGLIGGSRHDLYLGLPDSEWADPEFNSLEYDKLRSAVLDSPAANKVIVLDCCFSGRAVTATQAGPAELLGQLEVDGSYVLTAAHRDQAALIVPGEEYTAFTGRLVRLLRDGLPNGPELLTVDDLYKELLVQMKAEGLSVPQRRLTGTSGLLTLATNRAFGESPVVVLARRVDAAYQDAADSGDWAKAVRLLRETLVELERMAGGEHRETLRARQLLGHAIGGAGDLQQAAVLFRALLQEQARVLGEDHQDTLQTRQYLAVSLGAAGLRAEAIGILRVLLPDRRRILGGDDPHTLRTLHMLARNLAATGVTAEARALLRELVAVRERVLQPDHQHTERARADLAALPELLAGGD